MIVRLFFVSIQWTENLHFGPMSKLKMDKKHISIEKWNGGKLNEVCYRKILNFKKILRSFRKTTIDAVNLIWRNVKKLTPLSSFFLSSSVWWYFSFGQNLNEQGLKKLNKKENNKEIKTKQNNDMILVERKWKWTKSKENAFSENRIDNTSFVAFFLHRTAQRSFGHHNISDWLEYKFWILISLTFFFFFFFVFF